MRHHYEVLPISKNDRWSGIGEKWKVTYDGDNWGYFRLKKSAVKHAVQAARMKLRTIGELSELRIKRLNGTIMDPRTYGKDPRNTKG